MTRHRLIAALLIHQGNVVQTRRFKRTNMVGSAFTAVDFFNTWTIDEIVALEVSYGADYLPGFVRIIEELSRRCFVPLTVGGKVASVADAVTYTRAGADKVVVNTHAAARPELIREIAEHFGRQCVVLSIDAAPDPALPSGYRVVTDNGRQPLELDVLEWAERGVELGAGEIFLNAVEHDGDKRGYDLALVRAVAGAVSVPVVAMGGVGSWEHLAEGLREGGADAVAAGNIFHYTEHSTKKAKEHLIDAGLNMRRSGFYKVHMPRRPKYRPF